MPTVVVFLLVLSVLVLVHEIGHFVAAKLFGIRVDEFALGLPFTPPLIKFRFKGTQYAIYPLLFGGFVRLYGEDSETQKDSDKSYWSRGKKQRLIVVSAGVVMNLVLALSGFVWLYGAVGVPRGTIERVTVTQVESGSPASTAGFAVGDRIMAVEGKPIVSVEEFSKLMRSWVGLTVNVGIERGEVDVVLFEGIVEGEKKQLVLSVVPRVNPPDGQGPVGVAITTVPYLQNVKCQMANIQCQMDILKQGVRVTGVWVGRVFEGFRQIGKSLAAGQQPEGVAGPVGIYQLTGLVASEGFLPLVELVSVLSVNLAVFNVLPIPALDGGRALFIWLEWMRKKRFNAEFEAKVNSWGMAALLALMALISLQDVIRFGWFDKILGR